MTKLVFGDVTTRDLYEQAEETGAGFDCPDCGHQHTGAALAYICIGCLCPRTERPLDTLWERQG